MIWLDGYFISWSKALRIYLYIYHLYIDFNVVKPFISFTPILVIKLWIIAFILLIGLSWSNVWGYDSSGFWNVGMIFYHLIFIATAVQYVSSNQHKIFSRVEVLRIYDSTITNKYAFNLNTLPYSYQSIIMFNKNVFQELKILLLCQKKYRKSLKFFSLLIKKSLC